MSRGGYRGIGQRHRTAEACWSLSVWGYFQDLQDSGYFDAYDLEACEWEFRDETAKITTTRAGRTREQHIGLTSTPCNYGGRRTWFVCPTCARRVAKLFLPARLTINGASVILWLCRHCWNITYEQRSAHDLYNCYQWRTERIADRWLGEIERGWIGRKKGQHWRTFEQRADQYEELVARGDSFAFNAIERLLKMAEK